MSIDFKDIKRIENPPISTNSTSNYNNLLMKFYLVVILIWIFHEIKLVIIGIRTYFKILHKSAVLNRGIYDR